MKIQKKSRLLSKTLFPVDPCPQNSTTEDMLKHFYLLTWLDSIHCIYLHTYGVVHNSTPLLFMSIILDAGYISNGNECLLFRSWKKNVATFGGDCSRNSCGVSNLTIQNI